MAKKKTAKAEAQAEATPKVKKTFTISFDYNGQNVTCNCIGGKGKKSQIELLEHINSISETPVFTNIEASQKLF